MRLLPLLLASALVAPDPPSEYRRGARKIVRAVERRHEVVFTFDDGPHPAVTPRILDVLRERDVRAAFFACGVQLQKGRARAGRALLRRAISDGHVVGTHTVHHPRLSALEDESIALEIDGAVDLVERAIGTRPSLFRPPFGDLSPAAEEILQARELGLVLWSTNVHDYRMADPAAIAAGVLADLERKGGGVVILHDTHAPSAEALPLILDGIGPLSERRVLAGLPPLTVVGPDSLAP